MNIINYAIKKSKLNLKGTWREKCQEERFEEIFRFGNTIHRKEWCKVFTHRTVRSSVARMYTQVGIHGQQVQAVSVELPDGSASTEDDQRMLYTENRGGHKHIWKCAELLVGNPKVLQDIAKNSKTLQLSDILFNPFSHGVFCVNHLTAIGHIRHP